MSRDHREVMADIERRERIAPSMSMDQADHLRLGRQGVWPSLTTLALVVVATVAVLGVLVAALWV